MKSNTENKISIIIPAYNASQTLVRTMDAICNQSYKGLKEIIVVDDGSIDQTQDIVKKFTGIKYVYQENAGPASARNNGFYNSTGNILFFTDADCIPQSDWIDKALFHFRESNISVLAGSYGIANPNQILAKCIYEEILFRHKKFSNTMIKVFGSYNFAIRRPVFGKLGGFDQTYTSASGEDNDLSYRIITAGYCIKFVSDMRVDHFHPTKILIYLREQFNHGFWRAKLYLDHPHMTKGDTYTYWKDMFETGFVLMLLAFSPSIFFNDWRNVVIMTYPGLIILLLLFECFYGLHIIRSNAMGLYFGWVMFLRAFTRTMGFLYGIIKFLPQRLFR